MKTQDILLLGGALVVGSYFIGKGISGIKLPDINLPDINVDAPDVNIPDFNLGGLGGAVDDWLSNYSQEETKFLNDTYQQASSLVNDPIAWLDSFLGSSTPTQAEKNWIDINLGDWVDEKVQEYQNTTRNKGSVWLDGFW